jgi:subtilisin family serine protease
MRCAQQLIVATSVTILAVLLSALPAIAAPPPPTAATHIVMLQSGASGLEVAQAHGANVTASFHAIFNGFAANVPAGRLNALRHDPRVLAVEPNAVFQIQEQTVPTGVDRVEADFNPYADIDGVDERVNAVVAVVDTGVDGSHPDLNVNVSKSVDCTVSGSACSVGVAVDTNGHGTHVAGTIGALDNGVGVVGVAPGVEIWSVRVCVSGCVLENILKGHEYVSQNAGQIAVANLSIGGKGWYANWRSAIQDNVNKGVVVVVAAGNSKMDLYGGDGAIGNGNEFVPSSYPEALAVSALADSDGNAGGLGVATVSGADDTMASFSNYSESVVGGNPVNSPGRAIDIAAPGVDILSTVPGGYGVKSGTSMASPHVAGVVALHIAEHGRATSASDVAAIRQAIVNAAEPMANWRPNTEDTASDRDPNHEGSVRAGASSPPPPPSDTHDAAVTSVSTPSSVMEGDEATIGVTVTNNGSSSESFGVVLTLTDPSGAITTLGSQTVTLAAGGSTSLSFVWNTSGAAPGSHTLTAAVQLAGDEHSTNDTATANVSVQESLTDVAVDTISASSSVIDQGATAAVSVAVENAGNQTIGNAITVTLTDTTNGTTIGQQSISAGLTAGAATTVTFEWDTGGLSGTITLKASHDLADDNAANNVASLSVTVAPPPPSTLHVGDLDATTSKAPRGGGWSAKVTVLVVDTNGIAISDATVTGTFSQGSWTGTAKCVTAADGSCAVDSGTLPGKESKAGFTVTAVGHATLAYDSAANTDPDGDSNGTTIALVR